MQIIVGIQKNAYIKLIFHAPLREKRANKFRESGFHLGNCNPHKGFKLLSSTVHKITCALCSPYVVCSTILRACLIAFFAK